MRSQKNRRTRTNTGISPPPEKLFVGERDRSRDLPCRIWPKEGCVRTKLKLGASWEDPKAIPLSTVNCTTEVQQLFFSAVLRRRKAWRSFGKSTKESAGIMPRPKPLLPKLFVMVCSGQLPKPMQNNWCSSAEAVNTMRSRFIPRRPN